MNILEKLLGGVATPIVGYFTRRMELKAEDRKQDRELKAAVHERQVQLIREGLAADATWELEQIKNSGWKDEYVLLILSIPLVMCFVPGLAGYVLAGFNVLSATPSWYQWLIGVIFTAVYGIRVWRRQTSDT